jgi:acetyl esterase/lipase
MMRALALSVSLAASVAAQTVIPLWPGTPPGAAETPNTEATTHDPDGERRTRNITRPYVTAHLPDPEKANGTAVVIAPGGGYRHLAIDKEGHDVARWLNRHGIAGIVLSYRVAAPPAGAPPGLRAESAAKGLADAERAIRIVRSRAKEWKIEADRIGILGFSAGGNVAVNLGLHFDEGNSTAEDPIEKVSSRPTFLGMIYAAASEQLEFPSNTPPAFLVHAADDSTVAPAQSMRIFEAVRKAGAPAEMHIYERGGHGFGVRAKKLPTDAWTERFREWLEMHGLLRKRVY